MHLKYFEVCPACGERPTMPSQFCPSCFYGARKLDPIATAGARLPPFDRYQDAVKAADVVLAANGSIDADLMRAAVRDLTPVKMSRWLAIETTPFFESMLREMQRAGRIAGTIEFQIRITPKPIVDPNAEEVKS